MAIQPRPPRFVRLILGSAALLALVAIGAMAAVVLRDGQSAPEAVSTEGPTLVFAEFALTADEILVAPADDPSARTPIQTVPHASGWGLNAAPQMIGGRTAYTVLPPDAVPERTSAAELWLLDVDARSASRLARDADLLAAPVLRQDGRVLAYRRTEDNGAQSLLRVDLETRARRVLHTDRGSFGLFPVGFDDDGALLFTRLSANGTELMRVSDGSAAELVLHASDEIARDWSVSPDGDSVAYVAPLLQAERIVHQARVASLSSGVAAAEAVAAAVPGEQYSPTWRADGAIAIGVEAMGGAGTAPMVLGSAEGPLLPADTSGFDVPVGWSNDGRYLAVRHFSGTNSQDPGLETLVVVGPEMRAPVATHTELTFLGWTGA
jgi:hypothetical protein